MLLEACSVPHGCSRPGRIVPPAFKAVEDLAVDEAEALPEEAAGDRGNDRGRLVVGGRLGSKYVRRGERRA